jgi:hypothetical protein
MIYVILFTVLYLLAGAFVSFADHSYWNGRWEEYEKRKRPRLDFADKIYYFVFCPLTWPVALIAIPQVIFHKYPLKF